MKVNWFRAFILVMAGVMAAPAQAQFSAEDNALRKSFNSGVGRWNKSKDGDDALTICFLAWGAWAGAARESDINAGNIHGNLTHIFADGQLTHYANLMTSRFSEPEWNALIAKNAPILGELFADGGNMKKLMKQLGKCHVDPNSWQFPPNGVTVAGPEFMNDILQISDTPDLPGYMTNVAARKQFDEFVLQKNFASAANIAWQLNQAKDGQTIHWFELLDTSLLALQRGDGLLLDVGLLKHLATKWPDNGKRNLAKYFYKIRSGNNTAEVPQYDPEKYGKPKEPLWAKQEYQRYLDGKTNYTPCNVWHDNGC